MIRFERVTYTYPFQTCPAVSDISFSVRPGELVLCTGASGCGKSTLMRLANGLCPHYFQGTLEGRVLIGGEPTDARPINAIAREAGTLFQDPEQQFFALNVEDELAFAHEWQGVSPEAIAAKIDEAARAFRLGPILSSSIHELSEGQKQKVGLASILSQGPRALILDEPSANLDPEATEDLACKLAELKARGMAILVVDHRLYWLEGIADRVLVMREGRIAERGGFDLLYDDALRGRCGLRAARIDDPRRTLPDCAEELLEPGEGGLAVSGLRFAYSGKPALFDGVDVSIPAGVTALIGDNGTGKTTLSTDPKRLLIGDDEHGWDDDGVFNFEGGCYAKVINLSQENEPDIWNAIRRNALLENVTVDKKGKIDYADKSVTENTRVSYPIFHIENIVKPVSKAPAAKKVIFLSADAFGVLPPVSILTPEQTKYYFLSGFTAKLAGTERGITEPTPTFSACFGAAFLSLHPTKYGEELVKKMQKSGAKAYLVNTGWNGTGKRISIKDTRGIIDAILDGSIDKAPTKTMPIFDFVVPTALPGVDPAILDPRDTYKSAKDWEVKAEDLANRFVKNFVKFTGNEEGKKLVTAGPKVK